VAQDAAGKGRVQVEDRAGGEVGGPRVLVQEQDAVQVKQMGGLAGAFDVGLLELDTDAAGGSADRDQQGDVAEAGTEIDEDVGW
jgi:hypothetical protein